MSLALLLLLQLAEPPISDLRRHASIILWPLLYLMENVNSSVVINVDKHYLVSLPYNPAHPNLKSLLCVLFYAANLSALKHKNMFNKSLIINTKTLYDSKLRHYYCAV